MRTDQIVITIVLCGFLACIVWGFIDATRKFNKRKKEWDADFKALLEALKTDDYKSIDAIIEKNREDRGFLYEALRELLAKQGMDAQKSATPTS